VKKFLECKTVVPSCDAEIHGDSDEDVLRQAAEHARTAHGIERVDEPTAEKLRGAIRPAR